MHQQVLVNVKPPRPSSAELERGQKNQTKTAHCAVVRRIAHIELNESEIVAVSSPVDGEVS